MGRISFAGMSNFGSFTREVRKVGVRLPEKAIVPYHKAVHMKMLDGILKRSAVDTGFSRSNWRSSIGAPDAAVFGTRDRKTKYPGPESVVNESLGVISALRPYEVSYLSNGTDYILLLENGQVKGIEKRNPQAAQGMVSVTLANFWAAGVGSA